MKYLSCTCQITVASWLFKMLMSCVVFLLQLVFSCGSTLDFDVVLVGVTFI